MGTLKTTNKKNSKKQLTTTERKALASKKAKAKARNKKILDNAVTKAIELKKLIAEAKAGTLSEYNAFLVSYKAMKQNSKSFGFARAWILENNATIEKHLQLSPLQIKLLGASKVKKNYDFMLPLIRTSITGNHSPFYILQSFRKHEERLQNAFFPKVRKRVQKVTKKVTKVAKVS